MEKKISKKLLSLIIVTLMVVAVAAPMAIVHGATAGIAYTIPDVTGSPGDIVTVVINTTVSSHAASMDATINYNDSDLQLVFDDVDTLDYEVVPGAAWASGLLSANLITPATAIRTINIAYINNGNNGVTAAGSALELTFKILKPNNGSTPITFNVSSVTDKTLAQLPFTVTNGNVIVTGGTTATNAPTASPVPTASPTPVPTATKTPAPTAVPTTTKTPAPTSAPTSVPTSVPTAAPTAAPGATATPVPTATPIPAPTIGPDGNIFFAGNLEGTGALTGWGQINATAALSLNTTVKHGGLQSLKETGRTVGAYASPSYNIYDLLKKEGPGNYTIQMWVYADGLTASANASMMIRGGSIADMNSFVLDKTPNYYGYLGKATAITDKTWTLVTADLTVLASDLTRDTGVFNLCLDSIPANVDIYLDDVMIIDKAKIGSGSTTTPQGTGDPMMLGYAAATISGLGALAVGKRRFKK